MKSRSILALSLGLLMMVAMGAQAWASPQAAPAKTPSLYMRLGGYDAIAAVTDDFLGRLASDPQLGRFFVGQSTDSLGKIRQHIVDFLCQATGGPCVYHGRDMKTAHAGLKITESDWDVMVKHLNATMAKFKVPQKEQDEVLAAVGPLKADIVEKK